MRWRQERNSHKLAVIVEKADGSDDVEQTHCHVLAPRLALRDAQDNPRHITSDICLLRNQIDANSDGTVTR